MVIGQMAEKGWSATIAYRRNNVRLISVRRSRDDDGTVRLRTPVGEVCEWRQYKAIATDQGVMADFQQNQALIAQVKIIRQPFR
jgi:hypothetical protein